MLTARSGSGGAGCALVNPDRRGCREKCTTARSRPAECQLEGSDCFCLASHRLSQTGCAPSCHGAFKSRACQAALVARPQSRGCRPCTAPACAARSGRGAASGGRLLLGGSRSGPPAQLCGPTGPRLPHMVRGPRAALLWPAAQLWHTFAAVCDLPPRPTRRAFAAQSAAVQASRTAGCRTGAARRARPGAPPPRLRTRPRGRTRTRPRQPWRRRACACATWAPSRSATPRPSGCPCGTWPTPTVRAPPRRRRPLCLPAAVTAPRCRRRAALHRARRAGARAAGASG